MRAAATLFVAGLVVGMLGAILWVDVTTMEGVFGTESGCDRLAACGPFVDLLKAIGFAAFVGGPVVCWILAPLALLIWGRGREDW